MAMHSNYIISYSSGGLHSFKYLSTDFGNFNNVCQKREGTEKREWADSLLVNYSLENTTPGPWDYSALIAVLQDCVTTDLSENIFPVELGRQ